MKQLLNDLIAIKSYSGDEKRISEYIYSFFKNKNANVFEQDGNIVVYIKNNSKTAMIFNAHMDTVKVQDISQWNTDPFELVEKDGKYYGLGVSDEKISIAILMDIYDELMNSNLDIFLVFVVKEEIDGSGSKSFAEYFINNYNYKNVYCIICEPRNAKYIGMGNKGNIFFEISAKGKAAHSSQLELGKNAIDALFKKIKNLKKDIAKYEEYDDKLGNVTIACPTIISGGSSVNTIPDNCIAMGDVRTTPNTHQKIINFLNNNDEIKIFSETKPYILEEENVLVKVFNKLGIKEKQYTTGSNDAVFFGMLCIPAIVFGAGNEETIHKPNENVEIKNIEKTKKIYLSLVKELTI
ncbi:MAG: M20/M25/M40 family metallo-hydrolase [Nanoarchaeota archaeon]